MTLKWVPQAFQGPHYTLTKGKLHSSHSNHLQQIDLQLGNDHYFKSSSGTEQEVEEIKAQRCSTMHVMGNSNTVITISLFHEEML